MVPAITVPGYPSDWPTDNREGGVPDPATRGPSWIRIGSEGGFLPAPVVLPVQPITYVNDPTRFDFGNADKHSLLLAAAERADVLVDFSQYANKTLILYNDAPAAFPAGVSQYDYYTGSPDRTSTGGAPTVQPGYGPNVRTIMQIKVTNTAPAAPYDLVTLKSVFAKTALKRGVFESSQPPIIVPQIAYSSAYNQTFTQNNFARIADSYKNFTTLSGAWYNITFQPKALHDEMGAVYDEYGRMSGMLGLEIPSGTSITQTFTPYPYASPPTDVIMTSVGEMAGAAPGDGTQIWKITHNGVDSHPVHWHMYNVQVINRVGWDGFIRAPNADELGWKETLLVSPLEDTFVALRPVAVTVPFAVPDKIRALDPTMPLGKELTGPPGGFFDPLANGITVQNRLVNYGWEYVWHCHILAHEEMDMMHSQAISVNRPTNAPDTLRSGEVNNTATNTIAVYLAWRDRSTNETDWIILRSNITESNWTELKRVPSYSGPQTGGWAMAIDSSIPPNTPANYTYKVEAANVVGDDFVYAGSPQGFPTITLNTSPSVINLSQQIPRPNAAFTPTSASGNAPLNVTFADQSTGIPTGWNWDFGDGNFASDNGKQNPSHVYELPGNYTVRLTAMNTGGSNLSVISGTVNVTPQSPELLPFASFINVTPREGSAPFTVTFNADASTSTPPQWATWRWTFGDGTFSSVKNPVHTYMTGGNYTVSLAATNLGGTNVITRGGYINITAANRMTTVGVFRNGVWYLRNSNTNGIADLAFTYGQSGDIPIDGKWTGIGNDTVGVYRNGVFYLRNSNTGGIADLTFGYGNVAGDLPVIGDWNGDGIDTIGVYRNGVFYLRNSNTGGIADLTFGYGNVAGDLPVVGDWNGDGIDTIGVYRNGVFYLRNSNTNGIADLAFTYGQPGDVPVVGDWTASGIDTIGVYRNGVFYLRNNNTGGIADMTFIYGQPGDTPVIGTWV
jgi:PKD repeat protein/FtsP/CotA-like multicopper oxidase with cupredoxin domain